MMRLISLILLFFFLKIKNVPTHLPHWTAGRKMCGL
jgi:hypothetical protein